MHSIALPCHVVLQPLAPAAKPKAATAFAPAAKPKAATAFAPAAEPKAAAALAAASQAAPTQPAPASRSSYVSPQREARGWGCAAVLGSPPLPGQGLANQDISALLHLSLPLLLPFAASLAAQSSLVCQACPTDQSVWCSLRR